MCGTLKEGRRSWSCPTGRPAARPGRTKRPSPTSGLTAYCREPARGCLRRRPAGERRPVGGNGRRHLVRTVRPLLGRHPRVAAPRHRRTVRTRPSRVLRWPTATSWTVNCSTLSTSSGNWSTRRSWQSRCCAPKIAADSVNAAATGGMPVVRAPSSSKGKSRPTLSGKHRVFENAGAGERQTGQPATITIVACPAVPRTEVTTFCLRLLWLLRRPAGDRTKGRAFASQSRLGE